jgi:uncharacterized membrane protein YphA (DoxX/SURF4 family)
MQKHSLVKYLPWILALFIAIVFVQSLFFKFSNSFETQHIFSTIGAWIADIGLPRGLANSFAAYGGYTVGTVELIASILLLIPRTQVVGAVLSAGVIAGAIFFHLFTPLGVSVIIDEAGNRDGGQLFAMAVGVFVSALAIVWLRRESLTRLLAWRSKGAESAR